MIDVFWAGQERESALLLVVEGEGNVDGKAEEEEEEEEEEVQE